MAETITIPQLSKGKDKLVDYLKKLLSDVMLTAEHKITPTRLKILVTYAYQNSSEIINKPIVLIAPTLFSENDIKGTGKSIITLNKSIIDWFKDNTLIQDQAEIVFSITFFPNVNNNQKLPLLPLESISIPIRYISEFKTFVT
ncbi:hypothetical protein [Aquimarina algicola]|uniref:Uncharacterized protein n=1 Tax=Aquimarina algicola TaxID=2589995 RepID=A0A504J983_9FLAO|nr:hypothetical protein [Aquimarina algicola]TPN85145.1 hypothetical protein FHK87_14025 [Aquimarina algicola]